MDKDESFDKFYAKLKDIVNSTFNLEEQILEPKIVKKILRFLLERFHAKIVFKFGHFCHLFKVCMAESLMPKFQHIDSSTPTRDIWHRNDSIAIVGGPISLQDLNPYFINDHTPFL